MVYDSDGGSGEPGTLLDSMAVSSSNSGSLDTVCENLTQSITFDNSTAWVGWIGENTSSSYEAAATGGTKRRHMDLTSQTAPSTWNTQVIQKTIMEGISMFILRLISLLTILFASPVWARLLCAR
jgi:uncharacterized membrane protein YcfT